MNRGRLGTHRSRSRRSRALSGCRPRLLGAHHRAPQQVLLRIAHSKGPMEKQTLRGRTLSPSKHHTLRLQATDSVDRSQRCSARPLSYLFASMQFNTVASEESFLSTRGVSREGIGKHQLRIQPTQCPSCHDCRSWKRSPANPISAGSKSCCRYASSRLFSSQICRRYPDPPPLAR